jgi:hypothetical protein
MREREVAGLLRTEVEGDLAGTSQVDCELIAGIFRRPTAPEAQSAGGQFIPRTRHLGPVLEFELDHH